MEKKRKNRILWGITGILFIVGITWGIAWAARWSDYDLLGAGNIASSDTFNVLDISDTTAGPTGTLKQYLWSSLSTDMTDEITTTQDVTCTDSGDGNPGTLTITPTAGIPFVNIYLTVNDSDGCTITMGESGAVEGIHISIENESAANTATFTTSANVLTLKFGSPYEMQAKETINLEYRNSEWLETNRSGAYGQLLIGGGTVNTNAYWNSSGNLDSGPDGPVLGDPDSWSPDTVDYYGGYFIANAVGTEWTIPALSSALMHFSLAVDDSVTVNVNPDSTGTEDTLFVNGATYTQGNSIDITGPALCTFSYRAADIWQVQCGPDANVAEGS